MGGNQLTAAIMQLLPAIHAIVSAHDASSVATCPDCRCCNARHECPTLELAAASLDLVIQCWKQQKPPHP
jgi:hypothetical protein